MPETQQYDDYIEPPPRGFVPPPPGPADAFGLQRTAPPPPPTLAPAPVEAPPDEVIPPPGAKPMPFALVADQAASPQLSDAPPSNPEIKPVGAGGSGGAVRMPAGRPTRPDLESYIIQQGQAQYGVAIPPHVAAGIVDRMQGESGLNPTSFVANDVNGPSGGLFMHHNERLEGLANFAKQKNTNPADWRLQVDYGLHEWLGGGDRQAYANRDKILSAPDRSGAATSWDRYFERSRSGPGSLKAAFTGMSPGLQEMARGLESGAEDTRNKYHSEISELMRQANEAPAGSKERDDAIHALRKREEKYMDDYERIANHPPVMKPVDALSNFGSAGTIVALLGGLFARRHMTAALGAAGEAMKAINQNNWDQFQQQYKLWDHQSTTALNMVKLHNEQIRELIDDKRMAVDEKNTKIRFAFEGLGQQRLADMMAQGAHSEAFREAASLERAERVASQQKAMFDKAAFDAAYARHKAGGETDDAAQYGAMVDLGKIKPGGAANTQSKGREEAIQKAIEADVSKFKEENPDAPPADIEKARYDSRLKHEKEMAGAARMPRSAAAMATQKFLEEHPEATSDDLVRFQANQARTVAVERAFGSGVEARNVTSLNTVADHLQTFEEVAAALNNGDIPRLNALKNKWRLETGDERPLDFAVVQEIASREISRAVIGGPGAAEDRQAMAARINDSRSPEQLTGAFKFAKQLIAGRLDSLGRQYAGSDPERRRHFEEDMLSPIARQELLSKSREHQAAPSAPGGMGADHDHPAIPASKDEYLKLPKGTWYRDADGNVYQKQSDAVP